MTHTDCHLLIVDDDERIRALLGRFLRKNGYMVSMARDAVQARRLLAGLEFDLIVMDVMMPGEDGLALTRALRERIDTPILLLTAKGETEDRISGLESGADDYLPKPFEPRELLLRIGAILRRVPVVEVAQPKYLTLGALRYDTDKGELWNGDAPLRLTGTETALLDLTHGRNAGSFERSIDVLVSRIRRKIEPDPREPRFLQTVRGTGYMLVVD